MIGGSSLDELFGEEEGAQVAYLEETGDNEKENLSNGPPRDAVVDALTEATEVLLASLKTRRNVISVKAPSLNRFEN